jgi:HK97 family phage portal protein
MHGGLEWQQIGLSNEDSQWLNSRSFSVEEIARIFRVPSLLINHPDKTATFASAEQFFLSFVVHTMRPHLVRIEQSTQLNIFSKDDFDQGYFPEFNINALLRGDVKSRYEAYKTGREWGWLSPNDIRKMENQNPLSKKDGGDIYLQPMNFVPAGTPPQVPQEPVNGNNNKGDDSDGK